MGSPPRMPSGQPAPLAVGEFTPTAAPNKISFGLTNITPPSRVYLQTDDKLFVQVFSVIANAKVIVNARILRLDGVIVPLQFTFTASTALTTATFTQNLVEGFLLSCTISAGAALQFGQWTYAAMGLYRTQAAGANLYENLFSGYVSSTLAFGWPEAVPQRPTDGQGTLTSYAPTAPAAGAEVNYTVPTGVNWQILNLEIFLITDATVANRTFSLATTDAGGNDGYAVVDGTAIPATTRVKVMIGPSVQASTGLSTSNNRVDVLSAPAPWFMTGGSSILTFTPNLKAGDHYSYISIYALEWAALL